MKRTARYYNSPEGAESKRKKNAYQKEYNRRPEERKRRAELVQINRDAQKRGTGRKGDGLDASHTKRGIVMKKASVNRGSKSDSPGDRRARGKKK